MQNKNTGFEQLDKVFAGGLYTGRFYLLESEGNYFNDSATTLALNLIRKNVPVVYVKTHLFWSKAESLCALKANHKSELEKIYFTCFEDYVLEKQSSSPETFRSFLQNFSVSGVAYRRPIFFIFEHFESMHFYEDCDGNLSFETKDKLQSFLRETAGELSVTIFCFENFKEKKDEC